MNATFPASVSNRWDSVVAEVILFSISSRDDGDLTTITQNLNAMLVLSQVPGWVPEPGIDEFAVLFDLFVGQGAECIEKHSSRLLVCLSGVGECNSKFCFNHLSTSPNRSSRQSARQIAGDQIEFGSGRIVIDNRRDRRMRETPRLSRSHRTFSTARATEKL